MPHDSKGQVVEVGDYVTITFQVKQLTLGEDFCNVTLQSTIPMPPEDKYFIDLSAVNTKQTEKV